MDTTRPARLCRADFRRMLPMTTRLRDCDAYGHMNNAVFNEYFDTAVNQVLIEAGVLDMQQGEVIGLVVQSFTHYFAPVTYPERVAVGVRVGRLGGSSVAYEYAMFRGNDEDAAAQGGFTHVYVDRGTRRPVPLPAPLHAVLQDLLAPAAPARRTGRG